MKHFTNSDYALNKYSVGIVYRFADCIVEITLADYLAENPDKSEVDFQALKELSDADYFERDRAENAQTKRNTVFDGLDEAGLCHAPSPEELFIGAIIAGEEAERHEQRLETMRLVLDKLTETQRRRYLMYHVDGFSTWEIAEQEGANQKSIYESLQAAEKKIKKVLVSG